MRSLTIHYALSRLGILRDLLEDRMHDDTGDNIPAAGSVCVHCIGCDKTGEGATHAETLQIFRPLTEIIDFVYGDKFQSLILVINGIGINTKYNDKVARGKKLQIVYASGAYHELPALSQNYPPDLCIAFNAGIWGYDYWLPTLDYIAFGMSKAVPFVITAYNAMEADDDEDRIITELSERHVGKENLRIKWLWGVETNPFHSNISRPSTHTGETLTENACWICFTRHHRQQQTQDAAKNRTAESSRLVEMTSPRTTTPITWPEKRQRLS